MPSHLRPHFFWLARLSLRDIFSSCAIWELFSFSFFLQKGIEWWLQNIIPPSMTVSWTKAKKNLALTAEGENYYLFFLNTTSSRMMWNTHRWQQARGMGVLQQPLHGLESSFKGDTMNKLKQLMGQGKNHAIRSDSWHRGTFNTAFLHSILAVEFC